MIDLGQRAALRQIGSVKQDFPGHTGIAQNSSLCIAVSALCFYVDLCVNRKIISTTKKVPISKTYVGVGKVALYLCLCTAKESIQYLLSMPMPGNERGGRQDFIFTVREKCVARGELLLSTFFCIH